MVDQGFTIWAVPTVKLFLGEKFRIQKSCLCKRNDLNEVCIRVVPTAKQEFKVFTRPKTVVGCISNIHVTFIFKVVKSAVKVIVEL